MSFWNFTHLIHVLPHLLWRSLLEEPVTSNMMLTHTWGTTALDHSECSFKNVWCTSPDFCIWIKYFHKLLLLLFWNIFLVSFLVCLFVCMLVFVIVWFLFCLFVCLFCFFASYFFPCCFCILFLFCLFFVYLFTFMIYFTLLCRRRKSW